MSYITIEGNAGKEIGRKVINTKNGEMTICEFSVAVSRRENGKYDNENPVWWTVKTIGDFADDVAEFVTGGQRVVVSGIATQDRWEKDGEVRTKLVLEADQVGLSARFASKRNKTVTEIPADDEEAF